MVEEHGSVWMDGTNEILSRLPGTPTRLRQRFARSQMFD
jgi:hypothetical protein